jgi:hypothetical protein
MANFLLFFSVQGTDGRPAGPDPENRVGDQDTGSPGRLNWSTASLPWRRLDSIFLSVHVGSAMEKMAVGQVYRPEIPF